MFHELPEFVVPEYLVELLAAFMPMQAGACLRYRPLGEYNGGAGLPAALVSIGEETVDIAGEEKTVWRVSQMRLGGQTAGFFLVSYGRVVLSDYGGARAILSTREAALEGLHADLKPKTAD